MATAKFCSNSTKIEILLWKPTLLKILRKPFFQFYQDCGSLQLAKMIYEFKFRELGYSRLPNKRPGTAFYFEKIFHQRSPYMDFKMGNLGLFKREEPLTAPSPFWNWFCFFPPFPPFFLIQPFEILGSLLVLQPCKNSIIMSDKTTYLFLLNIF